MPSSGKKEAKIACTCNACELTLADGKATLHMLCGCEDCGQALQWGYKNGGIKPEVEVKFTTFQGYSQHS